MMLLITMAITVAYVASMATSLGWLELEWYALPGGSSHASTWTSI